MFYKLAIMSLCFSNAPHETIHDEQFCLLCVNGVAIVFMQANQQTKKAHITQLPHALYTTYIILSNSFLLCVVSKFSENKLVFSLCCLFLNLCARLVSGWYLCLRDSHPTHAIFIAQCDDIALNILNQLNYKRFETTSKALSPLHPI